MTARTWNLGGSSRTGLLLAGILAVLAGLLALVALRASTNDDKDSLLAGGASEAFVVVASQDIPARTEITSGMVTLEPLPANALLAGAYVEQDLVVGRIARIPIYRGEQLVQEKLASVESDLGLAYIVPKGQRAMAVEVDKVISAGGLLRPGDRVDVIGVMDISYEDLLTEREATVTRSFYIAQNIEVLAVEQELQNRIGEPGTTQGASASEGTLVEQPDAQPEGTVATLAITPDLAQPLLLVETKGTIRLSVRAPGDDTIVEVTDISPLNLTDDEYQALIQSLLATPR